MRITEVAKLFAGSCLIYIVVAACSAYSAEEPPASSSSGSSSGNASSSSGVIDPIGNALAEGHKSGSRLKLRFYEGSDGSRQFINFWDSQLQTDCTVNAANRTTDDKVRCLPTASGLLLYSDATCKTVFGYAVTKTAEQPKVVVTGVLIQGRQFYDFFTLGALKNAPAGAVYTSSDLGGGGGECGATSGYTATDYNFYAVGAPLPPSSFVEMTIKNE